MTILLSLSAEWLPVPLRRASDDEDLEVCVMDYEGMVLALAFPCHKKEAGWVDASNKKLIDVQPNSWRKWVERH